ncbi:mRNA interferase HigB [Catalinimonas alkaloidigena]|nr:mRNA interferase HigB [Catalinimonas alkaloidigena]
MFAFLKTFVQFWSYYTMNVIAKRTLREFWLKHPEAEVALKEWHHTAEKATWEKPSKIVEAIANTRFIGNNRFVFKIRGNNHCLVVKILFPFRQVYVRFVGTHAEYGQIDANTI